MAAAHPSTSRQLLLLLHQFRFIAPPKSCVVRVAQADHRPSSLQALRDSPSINHPEPRRLPEPRSPRVGRPLQAVQPPSFRLTEPSNFSHHSVTFCTLLPNSVRRPLPFYSTTCSDFSVVINCRGLWICDVSLGMQC
ncbi:hypothetical protein Csa_010298 [Cucumis sativus]|uniref:Uncharacterized protein n=1 Tax=Cucumis sativus TaxID=3659 RepID=A0A0A0L8E5_CUCSA|nr:hypothetical protein Csa_010298 [Cucumis sativus]